MKGTPGSSPRATRSPRVARSCGCWAAAAATRRTSSGTSAMLAPMVAKLIRPDQAEDDAALRALRREADALAALAHPVILRGFDAVLDPPHPHVLVEHLEGPTLRQLIREARTAARRAGADARAGRGLGAPLHGRRGLAPPRREAGQHPDERPAAGDRPVARAHVRARRRASASRSGRTRSWRPSSACRAASSRPPPTSGGSARRSTTPSRASARSRGRRPASASRSSRRRCGRGRIEVPDALAAAILGCLRADPAERPAAAELFEALRAAAASTR